MDFIHGQTIVDPVLNPANATSNAIATSRMNVFMLLSYNEKKVKASTFT